MRKKFLGGMLLLLGGMLAGCAGGYSTAFVAYGPPAPRYGAVGVAPGPGFVWIDGYWNWRGGRYVWAPGYWAHPPRRGAVWVRPEWYRHGNGWRMHEGHWR